MSGKRLYVGNLSFNTTEDTLRSAFEQNGRKVVEVKIVTDRDTGRPRGFGFVEMSSAEEAQAAIADWDGQQLDGRNLKVNEAQERAGGGGGGGGGGRGGGGRGGGGRGRY
jgi:RNA recognition motif-containing protein